MDTLAQDIRLASRVLRRNKGFAAATVLTLALGIGANTAVFSVVYGVLLRPLPYAGADRIVRLSEEHPGAVSPLRAALLSNLTFGAWSESPRTIEGMAAYSGSRRYTIAGFDEPLRIEGVAVSPQLLVLLGPRPALGRFFTPEEGAQGANAVVVLSHGFWLQQFGGDPNILGRTLVIDDRTHTIIGVTPPDFYFPDRDARIWTPFAVRRRTGPSDGMVSVLFAIARLKPGATEAQAEADGTAAARSIGQRPVAADLLFGKGGPVTVRVRSLVDEVTLRVRPALVVLGVGVGLVLLIACANVANLFLSRGISRSRELAVRAALGAGRGRLVQQLMVESLAISAVGGGVGLLLGWGLVTVLPVLAPSDFPRLADVRIDATVFTFATLASILAGLLTGLAPAVRGSRFDLSDALHGGTWSSARGFRGLWTSGLRGALLVAEPALAVMLLVGAGLLARSFFSLVRVDPGYDPANVLVARIHLPGIDSAPERGRQFLDALLERLRQTAGVVAAGGGNMAPFADAFYVSGFRFPAREASSELVMVRALQHIVTPGYAEALGLRLREGRLLTEADVRASIQTILVNQEFVRQYWTRGRSIVGARFQGLLSEPNITSEITGVIGDVLKDGLDTKPQPEVYLPARAVRPIRHINVVVRTTGDPARVAPLLRSFVREIAPAAAVDEVSPLAASVSASVSQPRFAAAVLGAFALVALALAAVGLYGVLAYNVSQRRRELGVRAALGATRRDLVRLVVVQGLGLTTAGLALGIAGSALLARFVARVLFGVAPHDAITFSVAPVVLLAVAVAACLLPARRAASANPAEALRCE